MAASLNDLRRLFYTKSVGSASGTVTDAEYNFLLANPDGLPTRTELSSTYGRRDHIATFIVAADGTGTHTTLGAAVAATTLAGTRILVKPNVGGYAEPATITLPEVDNCSIEGWGGPAQFYFAAGTSGIKFAGTSLRRFWTFRNLSSSGPGIADSGNGIGLDLNQASDITVDDCKFYTWSGAGIRCKGSGSDAGKGALYNTINNPYIFGCAIGIDLIGGVAGANQTTVVAGEISTNTTGIKADSAVGGFQLLGTSMETNGTALDWDGTYATLAPGRFEGNTIDTKFGVNSDQNNLKTQFFRSTYHIDLAPAGHNLIEQAGTVGSVAARFPELVQTMSPAVTNVVVAVADANGGFLCGVIPRYGMKVSAITFVVGTSSGNCQVAIQNADGYILAKSVSTAVGATGLQTVNFVTPIYLCPGERYRLVLAVDNTTATFLGTYYAVTGFANFYAMLLDFTSGYQTGVMPIGASISGVSPDQHTIWLRAS